jgi:hypothetical protein
VRLHDSVSCRADRSQILIGRAFLDRLKSQCSDNTRIGWVKAFELEPPELPFGRRMAEMIIAVHDFFDGTQVPLKKLPGSWKALYYLAAKVNDIALIEKLIAEQRITPISTESDLRRLDELRNRPKAKGSRTSSQTRAAVWNHLRDGLDSLGNMPLPDDVVTVAHHFDKQINGAAIDARLDRTIEWLTEFRQAWRSRKNGWNSSLSEPLPCSVPIGSDVPDGTPR